MWPIEPYISTSKKPSDQHSLRRSRGVSWSARGSGPGSFAAAAPWTDAPYPAARTAEMTACGAAGPSTPIELVRRPTAQLVTPGTWETAFSTRALHAAQLIPVTS